MPRRLAPLACFAAACLMPLTGCLASWRPVPPAPPRTLPAIQAIRLWRRGQPVTLRAVRLSADSISGVPWGLDPGCIPCRTSYALAEVDSLRTGRTDLTAVVAALGTGVVIAIVAFGYSRSFGDD